LEYNPASQQPTSGDKCLDLYSKVRRGQYADTKNKDGQEGPAEEFEKFKPLEIDPKIYRKDIIGNIKGMETFMKKQQQAHEKQAIEKLVHERNPDVILVAGMGAKKTKKRKYKQSKMYGGDRIITGKASESHENIQI
jgi:hypothetical protein